MEVLAATELAQACRDWAVGGWWPIFPLLWFGLILAFLFFFVGPRIRRGGGGWHGPSAESVLAERYARGEVDEKEYRSRLEVLRNRR